MCNNKQHTQSEIVNDLPPGFNSKIQTSSYFKDCWDVFVAVGGAGVRIISLHNKCVFIHFVWYSIYGCIFVQSGL